MGSSIIEEPLVSEAASIGAVELLGSAAPSALGVVCDEASDLMSFDASLVFESPR